MAISQTTRSSVAKRIEDWKAKLIDLSQRNKLLYFKHTKRGNLSVSRPVAEKVFNRLVLRRGRWEFWLPPDESAEETSSSRNSFSPAESLTPQRNELVCEGLDRTELELILKNLRRRSISDFRERGLRILYAAFGMLIWKEIGAPEEVRSPLVLVPIELTRKSVREPFFISVPPVEEDVVLNPALQVKLKNDYKLEFPPLPEEWESQGLASYFDSVTEVAQSLGWKVDKTTEIGLFSFHKLVVYRDLEANAGVIAQHPIVRSISGDKSGSLVLDSLPEEKDVDKIERPEKTFQVLDADSSQRICIDYALQGQSLVMQGPPGTGKSQTIANIIGESIAQGKSVLFVSDKIAALEVVYRRLTEAKLAHFCLELHSHKANKQEVVAELKRCLDEQLVPSKQPSADEFERMTEIRDRLNDYVFSLHQKRLPLGKNVYEVLGQLSTLEQVPLISTGLPNVRDLTPQAMHSLEDMVLQLKNVWRVVEEPDFPWHGYRGYSYDMQIRSELAAFLDKLISTIASFRSESARFSSQLGWGAPFTLEQTRWLMTIGNVLMESPAPAPNWVTDPNIDHLLSEAKTYQETFDWLRTTKSYLMERYGDHVLSLPLGRHTELEKTLFTASKLTVIPEMSVSELLTELEKLLILVKSMQHLAKEWADNSKELAQIFGLSADGLTIERAGQLARIALLCSSDEKPEPDWLNPSGLERLQEMLHARRERDSLEKRLKRAYTDGIFGQDLDQLIRRYHGSYQSFTRWLLPSFHRDQREIASVTHDGRVPKSVSNDLLDARRLKTLRVEVDAQSDSFNNMLGHFYRGPETDLGQVERAIAVASEIIKLSGMAQLPEMLAKLVSYGAMSPSRIKQIGVELQESVDNWSQAIAELSPIIPSQCMPNSRLPMHQTSLTQLQEWASETEKEVTHLCELTKDTLEPGKNGGLQNYEQLLEDLRKAEDMRKKEREILGQKQLLREKFGSRFCDLTTDWKDILFALQWTARMKTLLGSQPVSDLFISAVSRGGAEAQSTVELTALYDATLENLAVLESRFEGGLTFNSGKLREMNTETFLDRIKVLRERVDDLQVWTDFKDIRNRLSQAGLTLFLSGLTEHRPSRSQLIDTFRKAVHHEWIDSVYDEDPNLGRFRRENHEQLIVEFQRLDRELIQLSSNRVIQAANGRRPQEIWIQAADSEINTLSKEAAKKRRLMPIRVLFQSIPHLLFRLKPCLLMSPLSVSQFLSPELAKFDIVLFDEASQIVPEDAIGAVYRGKTIVIAGDNKQLPPTSFFQKSMIEDYDWDEASDEDIDVFDSILDECLGIGLPVKTLRWHYRSKHEELIAFSNHRFYDDRLITFPSAFSKNKELGVKLVYVPDSVYDRGGSRDNLEEAETVADIVLEHFRQNPKRTLGVVTFSIAQMEAVDEAIEHRLKDHPKHERYFKDDRIQGFFVKNLENVQGDERDVIILSVGYGRDQNGQMTMNFGPLNKPGGERRLNVAVTRAREKVILVTSIKASDIILGDNSPAGVSTLRLYLDYAERGPEALNLVRPQTSGYESPLDENVATEIRRMGYSVVPQVGCSGYRIDLGVVDPAEPGRFLLGVECDGATYCCAHSARDRDRLRQQVLEEQGWKIYHIWSPSWAARRESEIRRLRDAIENARGFRSQECTEEVARAR